MINNRQNGRRRGRGGQQPRGMSGNSGGNARDNRQRGNAAQLHEKYKSMARDAQLAGDRVQTEYYLQFADHYFRMLGDARPRFDEQKRGRDDDQDDGDDDRMDSDMDGDDDDGDQDEQPQRQQPQARPRNDREPRSDREPRPDREPRSDREPRADREPRRERPSVERAASDRAEPRHERPNGRTRDDDGRARGRDSAPAEDERIDFAVLPPAIGTASDDEDDRTTGPVEAETAAEAPRPRRRVRRPREEDDAPAG